MRWALVACVAGFVLRIVLSDPSHGRDEVRFLEFAAGGGAPHAQVMPLWPVTVSLLGEHAAVVFSTLTIFLAWLFARRLAGARAALVVVIAMAVDLDLAELGGTALSEPLYGFLLVAFALAWERKRTWLAAGLLGLAALTRPEAVFIPVAFAAWNREWRRPAILLAGVVVALTPWAVRNYRLFDAFIPLTTNGGITLWAGHNPADANASFRKRGQGRGAVFDVTAPDVEADGIYRRRAIAYATEHPGQTAITTAAKAAITFTPLQRKGRSFVWALATLAFWWAVVRRTKLATVGPLLCVMAFVCLVFLALPRYRAPYHPFLFTLAAAGVTAPRAAKRQFEH